MSKAENSLPTLDLGSLNNDFSAIMQILETYMGLYVSTCIPVIVEKYEKGKVDLRPVLIKKTIDGNEIEITKDDTIYGVPMLKIKANGWKFNFIAKKGDYGLLICSKFDITNYKEKHEAAPVGSNRTFSLSDGFYIPMDWDDEEDESGFVISNETTELTLGKEEVTIRGTEVNITATTANIEASTINLGSGFGLGVARIGDEVDLDTGLIKTGSSVVKAS
ncbi:MAG: hypothetical protein IJI42_02605 [Methanobrevibacter sp.]|nr:hypothetical protein [Methanobrevibacter sp.]